MNEPYEMTLRRNLLAALCELDEGPDCDPAGWVENARLRVKSALEYLDYAQRETYTDGHHMLRQGAYVLLYDPLEDIPVQPPKPEPVIRGDPSFGGKPKPIRPTPMPQEKRA